MVLSLDKSNRLLEIHHIYQLSNLIKNTRFYGAHKGTLSVVIFFYFVCTK